MIVIIDGYNVLKQRASSLSNDERERTQFLRVLARYVKRTSNRLMVVFDGGPYDRTTTIGSLPLKIIYSGVRSSADDVIIDLLDSFPKNADLVVVSSDRIIALHADSLGFVSVDADIFNKILYEKSTSAAPISGAGNAQKRAGHTSTPEVDALMQTGSTFNMEKKEEEIIHSGRSGSAERLSHKEKKLMAVLKKLV